MNNDLLRVFETESDYDSAKPNLVYPTVSYVRDVDEVYYMTKPVIPLYFEALEDDFTVLFNDGDLEYSLDGGTSWETLVAGEESPSINAGERIYLQGQLELPENNGNYAYPSPRTFILSQECNVGGNIMSLCNQITSIEGTDNIFVGLFQNTPIVDASELILPNEVSGGCYQFMFSYCTSLTAAPRILPATTLADSCYRDMFAGCTSLTTAPELPATTLVNVCYSNMFYGCTNLNYIKMMATDSTSTNALNYWVDGVSATGTFVKNPALSEDTIGRGTNGIPSGWTVVDAE